MDRRGKVPLEIEKVIKRQEVTETDMERGRFWRYCRNALNKGKKNYASIINKKSAYRHRRGGIKNGRR